MEHNSLREVLEKLGQYNGLTVREDFTPPFDQREDPRDIEEQAEQLLALSADVQAEFLDGDEEDQLGICEMHGLHDLYAYLNEAFDGIYTKRIYED